MNKKWVTIGVLGVLVLGGGYWGYKHFTAKPAVAANTTAKAKMGDVSKVITATGTVNFPHAIPLTFQQDGKIVELNVKVGDSVKAGQVLAKTDSTKLGTAVLQAQAGVSSAKAKLQTVKDAFNAQTKAQAQAALAGNQAKVALAQEALAKEKSTPTATTESLASLQANVTSAQANVTSSQYDVQEQAQGPKSADLQSAQASIDIAQVQLTSAQADVLGSSIIAPMDAVVVSAPLQLYQQSDPKTSIITITPAGNNLQVDAAIDQSDIAQVKVGQIVDVTLDAYPDVHNSGTVSVVAVQGTIVSNVTTFVVTVAVDKASDLLRAGMNANINIVVAEAKNVLNVPSEAIKTRGNKKSVLISTASSASQPDPAAQSGAAPKSMRNTGGNRTSSAGQMTMVEIGLDDGTNVEIKSGLKVGQEVITGTRSSTTAKTTSGFSLGGGGGNPAKAMGGGGGNRGN